jgi:hypothetical protein
MIGERRYSLFVASNYRGGRGPELPLHFLTHYQPAFTLDSLVLSFLFFCPSRYSISPVLYLATLFPRQPSAVILSTDRAMRAYNDLIHVR